MAPRLARTEGIEDEYGHHDESDPTTERGVVPSNLVGPLELGRV
jgi:hypothetical protein